MSGGSSESEQLMGGTSCAWSSVQLWKQECEEGNIPEPLCPDEWVRDNESTETRRTHRKNPHVSEPVFEEKHPPQDFQRIDTRHSCPECGAKIEFQAAACNNCLANLEWESGYPKVKEKIEIEEDSPSIAFQSRSSF